MRKSYQNLLLSQKLRAKERFLIIRKYSIGINEKLNYILIINGNFFTRKIKTFHGHQGQKTVIRKMQ